MAKEVERKFLVQGDSWRSGVTRRLSLCQGYLSVGADCSVRVRFDGEHGFLTVKGRRQGHTREEYEYQIDADEARTMIDRLCGGRRVAKVRHFVPFGVWTIVVDEYEDENAGLVLAELELDVAAAWPETWPEWIGAEVTDDDRFYNAHLSSSPFGSWS
ncbi:CYTH domain-containing protein [Blastococcus sp. TF02A-35]|nr:CYTH domain-containing protein [Blastococcus sp. TF02A_35]